MTKKQVVFQKEARERIKKGLDLACDTIKTTIGSKGRNAFIERNMTNIITNDGITIANAIELDDALENMGVWLVRNTSAQTNEEAGDGTSGTAVLLQAIVTEAMKRPESPMDIKKSLQKAGERVEKWIKDASQPITSDKQIEEVATISSESKETGKLIAEVISKVGQHTPITIEDNRLPEISYTVVEGLETKVGYVHPDFITNEKEGTAEMENAVVFATDRRISSVPELKTLLETVQAEKITSLVFLVSDIDNAVLGNFILSKKMGQFNSLVIRVRGTELEDMATACGATIISESNGLKFTDITPIHFGMARKITCTDKKTIILSRENNPMRDRVVATLRGLSSSTKNIYEAKRLSERADALEGGVAVINVGAHTDSEREYQKFKIEDAVNATKSAIAEGLVEGGGMCLFRTSNKLKGNSAGEVILRKALKTPLKAIIENAGDDYTTVIKSIGHKKGYNSDTGKSVDMFKAGIVDPTRVIRSAFQNALSTASNFVTMEVTIANQNETNKQ